MYTDLVSQKQSFLAWSSTILTALANPTRLAIMTIIQYRECSVGQICGAVDLSQSAVSQHLGKLRTAQLVTARKDAQNVYYSSSSGAAQQILLLLRELDI